MLWHGAREYFSKEGEMMDHHIAELKTVFVREGDGTVREVPIDEIPARVREYVRCGNLVTLADKLYGPTREKVSC